jgi:TonB-dependent receptor
MKALHTHRTFNKSKIANVIGLAVRGLVVSALSISAAQAEETTTKNDTNVEVIEVTGIRSSIQKSMAIKMDASGFVDAISAEDVGKLPDANVAEALQRIPGVSIQRNRGEGDFVSIRGLGPEFVRGTVNGRSLLSATEGEDPILNGNDISSTGRAANFDILPAEMISTLEVHKSASAKHVEGGIGGVVNVITARPFQLGHKFVGSVQGVYRDFNEQTDPVLSGLGSWVSDDETFGILGSVSYSERNIREDMSRGFGYFPSSAVGGVGPFDTDNDGISDGVTSLAFPLSTNQEVNLENRERLTLATTLQWALDDTSELALDVVYTKRDITANSYVFVGLPLPFPADIAGGTTKNPDGSFQVGDITNNNAFTSIPSTFRPETNSYVSTGEDEGFSIALNHAKTIGQWELNTDFSYSTAEGSNHLDTAAAFGNGAAKFSTTVAQDGFGINQTNKGQGASTDLSNAANNTVNAFDDRFVTNDDKEVAFQFDALREIDSDFFSSVEVGVRVRSRTKEVSRRRATVLKASENISLAGISSVHGFTNFLGGSGPESNVDFNDFVFLDNAEAREKLGISSDVPFDPSGTFDVKEDTFSAYAQLNVDTEFGGIPVVGNFGFRIVQTNQNVNGFDAELIITDTGLQDTSSPDGFTTGAQKDFSSSKTYTNVLPSLNLRFELEDNLFLRIAASQTLTRPTFNALTPGLSLNPNCSCDNNNDNFALRASAGNPGLDPYEATNFDLGLEWYFSDQGAAYASIFNKTLENYIAGTVNRNTNSLGSATLTVTGVEQDGSSHPITLDQISQPDNQGEASITGLELGYLQSFDSGFGYNLNLALTENTAEYITGGEIDFPGVSKTSYNATVFYEKEGFSTRLSYSYRSDYLLLPDGVGGLGSQIVADEYGQLDASISYDINENFTVFANAVNLNDEEQVLREEIPTSGSLFSSRSHVGQRFTLGIRGSF